eukprot:11420885-Karenia_brevis.AAC.1
MPSGQSRPAMPEQARDGSQHRCTNPTPRVFCPLNPPPGEGSQEDQNATLPVPPEISNPTP